MNKALLSALMQLAVMLAVAGGYFAASRRHRVLRHPIAIIVFVTLVSISVALTGAMYRGDWDAAPGMVRRSAIGGFGWGIVIAAVAWVVLRLADRRSR
jgi:hypothetical protein